jgi:hypothetical protein
MVQFTDKTTQKVFYKFGWTGKGDVSERFAEGYDDFEIKVLASLVHNDLRVIKALEFMFLRLFPKNIMLEEYLGGERTWDNFSGITEIVQLDEDRYKLALKYFYTVKKYMQGELR